MESVLKEILRDDFVDYTKVYELAAIKGFSKKEVRAAKENLGIKTIILINGEEKLWLWYIPRNVWSKYSEKR